ncbi:MAG: hypothetical protein ACKPKO_26415, partial [Candidatus Fonsibacter sp.]
CYISVANLQKLSTNVASNNGESSRVDFLSKYIFAQDMERIENMSKALKLCETAIKTITLIKFCYKEKLAQVPTIHGGVESKPYPPMDMFPYPHGINSKPHNI